MRIAACMCFILTSFCSSGQQSGIQAVWAREIKADAFLNSTSWLKAVEVNSKDEIIVAADFKNYASLFDTTIHTTGGSTDIFLATADSSANLQWIRHFRSNSAAWMTGLAVDGFDNIYIIMNCYDTLEIDSIKIIDLNHASAVLAKFSPAGDLLWYRVIRGHGVYGNGIATDGAGNVYFALDYAAKVIIESDSFSGFGSINLGKVLLKTDPAGNTLWYKVFTNGYGKINSVCTDHEGSIYMTSVGGHLSIDTFTVTAIDLYDSHLIKVDSSGETRWVKYVVGQYNNNLSTITADGSGNVYWAGYTGNPTSIDGDTTVTTASIDMIMIKYTAAGDRQWIRTYGGPGDQGIGAIAYNKRHGKLYLSCGGYKISIGDFKYEDSEAIGQVYPIRMDTAGNFESVYLYGGSPTGGEIEFFNHGDILHLAGFYDIAIVGIDTFIRPTSFVDQHGLLVRFTDDLSLYSGTGEEKPVGMAKDLQLSVYPNPSREQINIEYVLHEPAIASLKLYSATGQEMNSMNLGQQHSGTHYAQMNLSHLPKGLYYLKVTLGHHSYTKKIVHQ